MSKSNYELVRDLIDAKSDVDVAYTNLNEKKSNYHNAFIAVSENEEIMSVIRDRGISTSCGDVIRLNDNKDDLVFVSNSMPMPSYDLDKVGGDSDE